MSHVGAFVKYFTLFVVGIFALSACGGGSSSGGGGDSGGGAIPTAVVTTNAPALSDPALIPDNTVITITFSESMDTMAVSWQLAGDLASESNGGVWSMTSTPNDTLVISPSGTWFASTSRSLTVNALDLDGNAIVPVEVSYDIYRSPLYYVDGSKLNDTGNGLSPATARKFIHTTVAAATSPSTVLVNAGTYLVSHQLGTNVELRENVSLYGGYNANFSQRDPNTNITIIEDTSASATGSSLLVHAAIKGDGSVTPITLTTIIDGFTVQGTNQTGSDFNAAIWLINNAGPMVQNNILKGGSGIGSFGMFTISSSPTLQNNILYGDSGSSSSFGISIRNSSPILQNNTIHSGNGGITAFGISNTLSSSPTLQNNIIVTRTGSDSYCIFHNSTNDPQSLHNNAFFGCQTAVYFDVGAVCTGTPFCTDIDEINAFVNLAGGASNNVLADPVFVNASSDWHFSVGSPASITAGGLNGIDEGWSFNRDKDEVARPGTGTPWSIGAYEP